MTKNPELIRRQIQGELDLSMEDLKVDDLLEFDTMATKDVEMADVNGDGLDDIAVGSEQLDVW